MTIYTLAISRERSITSGCAASPLIDDLLLDLGDFLLGSISLTRERVQPFWTICSNHWVIITVIVLYQLFINIWNERRVIFSIIRILLTACFVSIMTGIKELPRNSQYQIQDFHKYVPNQFSLLSTFSLFFTRHTVTLYLNAIQHQNTPTAMAITDETRLSFWGRSGRLKISPALRVDSPISVVVIDIAPIVPTA